MSEWPKLKFFELAAQEKASFSVGPFGSSVTTADYMEEGVPFIRGVNLAAGVFIDSRFVFIDQSKAEQVASAMVLSGDLIFTRKGTIGQVSMIPWRSRYGRYVISGSQMKARLDFARADPEFYYYWFRSSGGQQALLAHVSAVGVPSIPNSLATLKEILVPVPPLCVQRSIVAVLRVLDDKIELNERIAIAARQLALGYVDQAVQSQSELSSIASISDVVSRGISPHYVSDGDGLLIINQKCIREGRVTLDAARRTERDKVSAVKMLKRNDVLVNSTGVGTLGRVARWTLDVPSTVDSHVTIVRFDPAKTDPVCAGFGMLLAQPEIEAMGEGSTGQTELSRIKLGALPLRLPPIDVMRSLRPSLDVLEASGQKALEESRVLANLRDALLPGLMSGEIRVRDAEKVVEDAT